MCETVNTTEKLDQLEALARKATPGPWLLQDSCSWRRIGTDPGSCGDVLLPVVQSDGQPDISASRGDLEYVAAADPTTVLSLFELVRNRDLELTRHQERFDILVCSVAAALERAGVTEVDDPGEAIDVLVADKDEEIARLREAIQKAYGYLWHVNNEPRTPNQHSPEAMAYQARKVLRDLLTSEQRGVAMNTARAALNKG